MAKNNVLKINAVLKLTVHEALIFLACDISENKLKIKEMKKTANTNTHEL